MSNNQNQLGLKYLFGRIYLESSSVVATFGTTPFELSGLSTAFTLDSAGSSALVMTTDGRLKYTGTQTKTFRCSASAGSNVSGYEFQTAIRKNGVSQSNAIAIGPAVGCPVVVDAYISLATNDYLSLFVNYVTGSTGSYNIYNAQISVVSTT